MKYICERAFVKDQEKFQDSLRAYQFGSSSIRQRFDFGKQKSKQHALRIQRLKKTRHYYCLLSKRRFSMKNQPKKHSQSELQLEEKNVPQAQLNHRQTLVDATDMKDTETILNEETINRISEEGLKPKTRMRKDPIEVDSFTQQQMGGEGSIYIGSSQQARRVSSRVLSKIFKNNLSNLESMRMVLKHNPELSPIDLTNILTSIGIHNL